MIAEKNLHVPDDLLAQAQRRAQSQGRTADDVAADALKRYLVNEMLKELSEGAEERRRAHGLTTDEDVEVRAFRRRLGQDRNVDRRIYTYGDADVVAGRC